MKKKNIIRTLGAIGFLSIASAAIYNTVKVSKKMKPYPKKYHFNGNHLQYDETFESDAIAVNCGHLKLDFENATLNDNLGTLKVFGYASKISVFVPDNWVIKTIGVAKNSHIVNPLDDETHDNHPTLIIKHDLHFSMLDIQKHQVLLDEQPQAKDDSLSFDA
jgi:hypothetical protein